jgi:hypothetical protein
MFAIIGVYKVAIARDLERAAGSALNVWIESSLSEYSSWPNNSLHPQQIY